MRDSGYAVKRKSSDYSLFQVKKPLLGHLDIELTERCNNACRHCYINLPAGDQHAIERELNTDQWKEILKQATDLGALSVRITGGEPLLRPDFSEIYLFARRLGLKIFLFTNACLITPELADLFARVPPMKKIEISMYGMHPASYDAVTCTPGSYQEFRRSVDLLLEKQVPFFVKSVLLPHNRDDMEEFEIWSASLPWMDRQPSYAVFLDYRTRRDSLNKNRLIDQLRLSPEEGLNILAREEEAYRKSMAQFCAGFIGPTGDRLFSCDAGESGCVDAYGMYQMCMLLRHPDTVFDLKQGTLHEALTGVFPRLRGMKATNPDYLERCALCFLMGLCEQCPGKSWSEHGTLDTPVEYLCQVAHAQARYLGLLGENESGWGITDWQRRVSEFAQKFDLGRSRKELNHDQACREELE